MNDIAIRYWPEGTIEEIARRISDNSGFEVVVEVDRSGKMSFITDISYDGAGYGKNYRIEVHIDGNVLKRNDFIDFPEGLLFLEHVIYLCGGREDGEENVMPPRYIEPPKYTIFLNDIPLPPSSGLTHNIRTQLGTKWNCDCFQVFTMPEETNYFRGKKMIDLVIYYNRSEKGSSPYEFTNTEVHLYRSLDPNLEPKLCYLRYNEKCEDRYYGEFIQDIIRIAGGPFNLKHTNLVITSDLKKREKLPGYLSPTPHISNIPRRDIEEYLEFRGELESLRKKKKDEKKETHFKREKAFEMFDFYSKEGVEDRGSSVFISLNHDELMDNLESSIVKRKEVISQNNAIIGELKQFILSLSSISPLSSI